jgi:shikimate kinase
METMMKIINICGLINAGKSTVSKLLAQQLPNSAFIEFDDLVSEEEKKTIYSDIICRNNERFTRLYDLLSKHIDERQFENIIFAGPMMDDAYDRIAETAKDKAEFIVINLLPDAAVLPTNRGDRELSEGKKKRLLELISEDASGYHKSDKVIDNTRQSSEQTVNEILDFLSQRRSNPELPV